MALYGISLYGIDTYGPSPTATGGGQPSYVDFFVDPFVADALDYSSIRLTWKSPSGNWDHLRVLRNWNGFSVDENDGEVLLDTTGASTGMRDFTVRPGAWHYYSIWVESGGVWYRASIATTLMLAQHSLGDRLFNDLPLYHRYLHGVTDDLPAEENSDLKAFLQVLGYGLDYIKTYYDSLRYLNDPMRNHASQLAALATQLGITFEPSAPPNLFRKRVQNAGSLGRQKGTLEQVRSVIAMTVGYDVDLSIGPNLMLSEDASSFVHPQYDTWSPGVNYAAGERVSYNGYIYQANTGGAYGQSEAPAGTATSNSYWSWVNGNQDSTLVESDGTVAGWEALSFTTGVAPGSLAASIGVGVQSATDGTVSTANNLMLKNNSPSNSTADLGVHSTGAASADPVNAVTRGIPTPRATQEWVSTTTYPAGALVTHGLHVYRASQESTGVAPSGDTTDNASWACLGVDDRAQVTGSVYVKGQTGQQNLLAYPLLEFYDSWGKLQAQVDTSKDLSTNVFDPFNDHYGTLSGRSTPVGSKAWTVQSGGFTVRQDGSLAASGSGSLATISGSADGQVSTTFATSPSGSATEAVVFRAASGTSYLKATRTGLYSSSGGTDTLIGTYSTALKDKDRITVAFTGSTITVYRNGVSVLSATSTTNSTATMHGILVS